MIMGNRTFALISNIDGERQVKIVTRRIAVGLITFFFSIKARVDYSIPYV